VGYCGSLCTHKRTQKRARGNAPVHKGIEKGRAPLQKHCDRCGCRGSYKQVPLLQVPLQQALHQNSILHLTYKVCTKIANRGKEEGPELLETPTLLSHPRAPRRSALRRSRYVRTLPCESSPLACSFTEAPETILSARTVAVGCTGCLAANFTTTAVVARIGSITARRAARTIGRPRAGFRACTVAKPDPTRCTTYAVGAVAATARSPTGAAGAAIR
jgi:hypothetical protein